jgi:hypothetical protein
MKNLLLSFVLISLLASCDLERAPLTTTTLFSDEVLVERVLTDSIANPHNSYDYCGQLFSVLHDAYYATSRDSVDIATLVLDVERVADGVIAYSAIKPLDYQSPLPERIRSFVAAKDTCLSSVLDGTGISAAAASEFSTFLEEYLVLCSSTLDYAVIYSYVLHYEESLLSDSRFDAFDKKVLLSTTSIARYSAAKKKRPKKNTDPAWEFLICGIYGSIEGAASSPAEAISLALASAIAENQ